MAKVVKVIEVLAQSPEGSLDLHQGIHRRSGQRKNQQLSHQRESQFRFGERTLRIAHSSRCWFRRLAGTILSRSRVHFQAIESCR